MNTDLKISYYDEEIIIDDWSFEHSGRMPK